MIPEQSLGTYAQRDRALNWLVAAVPYIQFLGIRFDRKGEEITAHMPFQQKLIGNPAIQASKKVMTR